MAEVFIVGDSHAVAIRNAFLGRNWKVFGGVLQAGRAFERPFFEERDGHIRLLDERMQAGLSSALARAGVSRPAELNMPIITTLGFNSHRLARMISDAAGGTRQPPLWSSAVLDAAVSAVRGPVIEFCKTLPKGRTFAVPSPRRVPANLLPMLKRIEDIYSEKLAALGIRIVDVNDRTTDNSGVLRREFHETKENDRVHANKAYGDVVIDRVMELLDTYVGEPQQ